MDWGLAWRHVGPESEQALSGRALLSWVGPVGGTPRVYWYEDCIRVSLGQM